MGGTQSPPSFTEFSGFVLSALAMENLCLCMWGGSLSCTSFSTPVLPSAFLVLVELGFAVPQSHNTAKNPCVPVGGGPAPTLLGSVLYLVSGAVIFL